MVRTDSLNHTGHHTGDALPILTPLPGIPSLQALLHLMPTRHPFPILTVHSQFSHPGPPPLACGVTEADGEFLFAGIIKSKSLTVGFDTKTVVTGAALFRSWNQIKSEMAKFRDALSKGQTAVSDLAGINSFNTEIIFEEKK